MTLQNIREEFYMAPPETIKNLESITDFFLDRFQAHLERVAEEVNREIKSVRNLQDEKTIEKTYAFNEGLTTASQIIRNSLKS